MMPRTTAVNRRGPRRFQRSGFHQILGDEMLSRMVFSSATARGSMPAGIPRRQFRRAVRRGERLVDASTKCAVARPFAFETEEDFDGLAGTLGLGGFRVLHRSSLLRAAVMTATSGVPFQFGNVGAPTFLVF